MCLCMTYKAHGFFQVTWDVKQLDEEAQKLAFIHLMRIYCTVLDAWDNGGTTKISALTEPPVYQRKQMININMVGKCFAKAEGQVAT